MASKVNLDISEKLDITCRKGDTFSLTLTLKDSAGSALALATLGYEFLMQVWPVKSSPRARGKSIDPSPIIGSSNLGKKVDNSFESFVVDDLGNVTITATASTMQNVPSGRFTYDIQYIIPSTTSAPTHTTILNGAFMVNEDISKSL